MFKKILIANRGEIAVRIIRTAREMGIQSVALFEYPDRTSLHARLADECVEFKSPAGFIDQELILQVAREKNVDAIHPGYGFLTENVDFIRNCERAGFVFIGPPAPVLEMVSDKLSSLAFAKKIGAPVIQHSAVAIGESDLEYAQVEADNLGYPVVIKSCRGGRGRGERLVRDPKLLKEYLRKAQFESHVFFGDRTVYLEKAISNAHLVSVPVIADEFGNIATYPEFEGSILLGNQKLITESPSPSLNPEQRERLRWISMEVARRFKLQNAASIEYLIDNEGHVFFLEIKPRLPVEHPVVEMVTHVDLVREQILVSAGEELSIKQENIHPSGVAIQCRIVAEDPKQDFLPSPGQLKVVRFPGGGWVRVDSHVYSGCSIASEYDTLIGKLSVWGTGRVECIKRLQVALEEMKLIGIPTNLPLLQQLLLDNRIKQASYDADFKIPITRSGELAQEYPDPGSDELDNDLHMRDLAVAAAILYLKRNQSSETVMPLRLSSGWHRNSRRLPE